MSQLLDPQVGLVERRASRDSFRRDVIDGLSAPRKMLHCKYLYDRRGSELFDEICGLDEYYLTRTELAIMRRHADEIAACCGERCMLIEYGSGSSTKTRLLLDALERPAALVTIDISREHLAHAAAGLAREFPEVKVVPVCADYTESIELPAPGPKPTPRVAYFPGSTIGNFHADAARAFLQRIATMCGRGSGLLIGVDLAKDRQTLEVAYNDERGVTAEFNLNLLHRINRELGGNFQVDRFTHRAVYRESSGRIEMHLVSRDTQSVRVGDSEFEFAAGETIRTECSYKYSPEQFEALADSAGFDLRRRWIDPDGLFSLIFLEVR